MKSIALLKTGIVLLAALASGNVMACSCAHMGIFHEYAGLHPIVIRGTVVGYGSTLRINENYFGTMVVAVDEVIKGSLTFKAVEFYGDTGMSCLRYISEDQYPPGSEHLFILQADTERQPLLGCGEVSVVIDGDRIIGSSPGTGGYSAYEMALEDLIQLLE